MNPFKFHLPASVRSKGRRAFMLRHGIGLIGIPVAVIFLTEDYLDRFGLTTAGFHSRVWLIRMVTFFVSIGLGSGTLFGLAMWRITDPDDNS